MNKLKVLCFTAAATISSMSYAGHPGDEDCDAWLNILNRCEAGGFTFGKTCSEVYYTWRDCLDNVDNGGH